MQIDLAFLPSAKAPIFPSTKTSLVPISRRENAGRAVSKGIQAPSRDRRRHTYETKMFTGVDAADLMRLLPRIEGDIFLQRKRVPFQNYPIVVQMIYYKWSLPAKNPTPSSLSTPPAYFILV
jgi:hypothetical protein